MQKILFDRRGCNAQGFTLIELMVVIVIVGVLAAVSYPTYREHIARTRRGEAKAVLLEAVQWMERNYTLTNRYDRLVDGTEINDAADLPASLQYSPRGATSADAHYSIHFAVDPTRDTFTLIASPLNLMTDDHCGVFNINNTGARSIIDQHTGITVAQCWDR